MRIPRRTLYFGHPYCSFGTEAEIAVLRELQIRFPNWDILNPNEKHFQNNYAAARQLSGGGMDYVFRNVLPNCHSGVFLLFLDGKWGAGNHGEAIELLKLGKPVWTVTRGLVISEVSVRETAPILPEKVLSIEETRARKDCFLLG